MNIFHLKISQNKLFNIPDLDQGSPVAEHLFSTLGFLPVRPAGQMSVRRAGTGQAGFRRNVWFGLFRDIFKNMLI